MKNEEKNDVTVTQIIEQICSSICDSYCKYPEQYEGSDDPDRLYEEHCDDCPLMKL